MASKINGEKHEKPEAAEGGVDGIRAYMLNARSNE